jgi:SpoVK/Ycf46/Vps4 family AAA+-type ATPase
MNDNNDLWGDHPVPVRVRWRLLGWVCRHRPGEALDRALEWLGTRLKLELRKQAVLEAELTRQCAQAADMDDYLRQLGVLELGEVFALSGPEQVLLGTLLQLELDSELNDWLAQLDGAIGNSWHVHQRLLAELSGLPPRPLAGLLTGRSTLIRTELVQMYRQARLGLDDRFGVRSEVLEYCADGGRDLQRLCASYFTACGPGELGLADYPELEGGIARMRAALRSREAGTHILLHGPPGTGKTQLAHALAHDLGMRLYAVPCQDSDGDPIEHQARLRAFAQAQLVLSRRQDAVLLFDEVEDVIRSAQVSRDGKHRAVSYKGWLHEQLERAPLPSIWISNSLACFDEAQLRRFACIVEVPVPALRHRRELVRRATGTLQLDPELVEGISRRTDVAPAELRAVAMEAGRCDEAGPAFRDALDARLRASGRPRLRPQSPPRYDLQYVHTVPELAPLLPHLERLPSARVLLSGPPGSGKTALVLHLAEQRQQPLLLKRASDLLSPWIGETEQKLAAAFDEASRDQALLLLDEADSFLLARHSGQRSWELSQVNELLKQLEDFDGLFFAATNLPDLLDPAALRRFDFKLHFDWLPAPSRLALLQDFLQREAICCRLTPAQLGQAIERLPYLLPGDLAALRRRVEACRDQIDDASVLAWLSADHALKPAARARGIGYAANF